MYAQDNNSLSVWSNNLSPAYHHNSINSHPFLVGIVATIDQSLPALPSPTPPSPKDTILHPIIESGKQLQPISSHSNGKMAKATLLTSSANIGSLQLCGPCSSLSCSGGARLPPSRRGVTQFRQPLQVQSHLEMPRILVQLGHIQCT